MDILNSLASVSNRNDETLNIQLTEQIVAKSDENAIAELVKNLDNKNKAIQNDCIKVLYEIGERKAELITNYTDKFIQLLTNKNNRLVWGAMMALDWIASSQVEKIHANLDKIIVAANQASIIAKDHAVNILIKLCKTKIYQTKAFAQLIKQLETCPTNQLPMYAENALVIINTNNKLNFAVTLNQRIAEIEKESKRKRVEKVIGKLAKI